MRATVICPEYAHDTEVKHIAYVSALRVEHIANIYGAVEAVDDVLNTTNATELALSGLADIGIDDATIAALAATTEATADFSKMLRKVLALGETAADRSRRLLVALEESSTK